MGLAFNAAVECIATLLTHLNGQFQAMEGIGLFFLKLVYSGYYSLCTLNHGDSFSFTVQSKYHEKYVYFQTCAVILQWDTGFYSITVLDVDTLNNSLLTC